jgi:hypothetical protein
VHRFLRQHRQHDFLHGRPTLLNNGYLHLDNRYLQLESRLGAWKIHDHA